MDDEEQQEQQEQQESRERESPSSDETDLGNDPDEDPSAPDAHAGTEGEQATEEQSPALGAGADDGEHETFSVRTVNRVVVGELTLHYPSRDVTLVLDGEAAIRVLTMFWRRHPGVHADRLDPETSSALSAWVVLDLGEPLAVSWYPTLGSRPTRTAIDPTLPQAA